MVGLEITVTAGDGVSASVKCLLFDWGREGVLYQRIRRHLHRHEVLASGASPGTDLWGANLVLLGWDHRHRCPLVIHRSLLIIIILRLILALDVRFTNHGLHNEVAGDGLRLGYRPGSPQEHIGFFYRSSVIFVGRLENVRCVGTAL